MKKKILDLRGFFVYYYITTLGGSLKMYCPNCGKEVIDNARFCPHCGAELATGAAHSSEKSNKADSVGLIDKIKQSKIVTTILGMSAEQKKKVVTISAISAASLVVLIAVIVVIVSVSTNIFKEKKVSAVELGATAAEVRKVLGKPDYHIQNETAVITLSGVGDPINAYLYYDSKAMKYLKKIDRNGKKMDKIDDYDALDRMLEKESKLLEKLEKVHYKSIIVAFDSNDQVIDVGMNMDSKYSDADYYLSWSGKTIATQQLSKTKISTADSWMVDLNYISYETTYTDKSYRKAYFEKLYTNVQTPGNQTLSYENGWATLSLNFEVVAPNVTVTTPDKSFGTVSGTGYYEDGDNVTLTATARSGYLFDGWYLNDTRKSTDSTYTFNYNQQTAGEYRAAFIVDVNTNTAFTPFNVTQSGGKTTITGIKDKTATSITIPDMVTEIGDKAFNDCSNLTEITIPDSVISIGVNPFDCNELKSIYYSGDITGWCGMSRKSSILNSNRTLYIDGSVIEGDLIIPDTVASIEAFAFQYCKELKSVTIPDSVKSIGNSAFYECSGLTSVTIGNSVTTIGDAAFYKCSGLTSITIPDSVTSIGCAFWNCSGLTSITIGNSVTTIGDGAFEGCSRLTSITIPDSVTSIGNFAFESCGGLTSVTIPNSMRSIGELSFCACRGLTTIDFDGTIEQWNTITKADSWDDEIGNYTIRCTDGNIRK